MKQNVALALVLGIVYLTLIFHLNMLNVTDAINFFYNSAHVVGNSRYTANICAPDKIIDSVINRKNTQYSAMHISLLF